MWIVCSSRSSKKGAGVIERIMGGQIGLKQPKMGIGKGEKPLGLWSGSGTHKYVRLFASSPRAGLLRRSDAALALRRNALTTQCGRAAVPSFLSLYLSRVFSILPLLYFCSLVFPFPFSTLYSVLLFSVLPSPLLQHRFANEFPPSTL